MKINGILYSEGQLFGCANREQITKKLIEDFNLSAIKAERLLSGEKIVLWQLTDFNRLENIKDKFTELGLSTHIGIKSDGDLIRSHFTDKDTLSDEISRELHKATVSFVPSQFKRLIFHNKVQHRLNVIGDNQGYILARQHKNWSESASAVIASVFAFLFMQHMLKSPAVGWFSNNISTLLGITVLLSLTLFINSALTSNHCFKLSRGKLGYIWCRSVFFSNPLKIKHKVYSQTGSYLGHISSYRGAKTWWFMDRYGGELYRVAYEFAAEQSANTLASEMKSDLFDFDYFSQVARFLGSALKRLGLNINLDSPLQEKSAWVIRESRTDIVVGQWQYASNSSVNINLYGVDEQENFVVLLFSTLMAGKLA